MFSSEKRKINAEDLSKVQGDYLGTQKPRFSHDIVSPENVSALTTQVLI